MCYCTTFRRTTGWWDVILHIADCTASLLRHTALSMVWSDPLQVRPKHRSVIGWPHVLYLKEVVAILPPVELYILIGLGDFQLQVMLLGNGTISATWQFVWHLVVPVLGSLPRKCIPGYVAEQSSLIITWYDETRSVFTLNLTGKAYRYF